MKVVISGYYGCGNAGDEAVLAGMLRALGSEPPLRPVVLSGAPEETRALHGVEAIPRYDLRAVRSALKGADLFLSGGGGLLQDRTSRRSPLYYLALIRLARALGVPVYMYAQGVGPLETPLIRRIARRTLRGVAGAGVRDPRSREELIDLGLPPDAVRVTADAAFALEPPRREDGAAVYERLGRETPFLFRRRPLLGIVWRSPHLGPSGPARSEGRLLEHVAHAAAGIARELAAGILVIGLDRCADPAGAGALAAEIRKAAPGVEAAAAPSGLSYREWLDVIAGLDAVVSVRYHGLLFASLASVPAFAIAYDPKVRSLAGLLGVEALPLDVSEDALAQTWRRVWKDRQAIRRSMEAAVAKLSVSAREEGRRALAFARGGVGSHA